MAACTGMPAATPPALKKTAITSLPGGVQAGQVIGVPGETRIYIIGHKNGNIYTVDTASPGAAQVMMGAQVSVATGGNNEQGLLGIALHPNFAANKTFYLFYTASGGGRITIDEFERTGPAAAMKKGNLHNHTGSNQFHNGGSIYFNPKDSSPIMYLSVGDAQGRAGAAGSPEGTNGRILKIDTASKMASSYHYNIRNPYRMSIDRLTGDMWIGNVAGPQGGRIIFAAQGSAARNMNHDATPNPINGGLDGSGNAIIGGVVYRGSKIPALCGRYFYGQHNSGLVKSLIQSGGSRMGDVVTHGTLQSGGLSSFGEDGAGELYISTLGGAVSRIDPM
jgi:glucose/arabinose dehydrogenase